MKRRFFSVFVALALCLSLLPGTALAEGDTSGTTITADYSWYTTPTSEDTYTIDDEGDLLGFANIVNGEDEQTQDSFENKTVTLSADLDLSGIENWTPIGTGYTIPFSGTFDGKGKTISGLKIDVTPDNIDRRYAGYYGLFGYVGDEDSTHKNGTVKNLTVSGSISVNATNNSVYVGGLVGNCDLSIQNCQFSGSVHGSANRGSRFGGVAGYVYNIKDSYNISSVRGSGSVGGLAGEVYSSENSYNTGDVSGSGQANVGGVAGSVYFSLSNCYNTGSVRSTGDDDAIGGVAGRVRGSVSNSYNVGSVSGNDDVGGVAGFVSGNVSNCFYPTDVAGKGIGGGDGTTTAISAADFAKESTFVEWNFTENTDWVMSNFGRPLLAWEQPDGTEKKPYRLATTVELEAFRNLINDDTTNATYGSQNYQLAANLDLSGIDNWTPIGKDDTCAFSGTFDGNGKTISGLNVTGSADGYYGLFGYMSSVTVKNLAVSGSVSGSGTVGGIVGHCGGTIRNCQFSGTVSGSGNVGGLAGLATTIENSYNTGNVSGSGTVGGVAGMATTITNCYNTGNVSGSGTIGGVVGNGNATNCFYLTDTAAGNNGTATGISVVELADKGTFTNGVGWDFTNTWVMGPFRPLLAWEEAAKTTGTGDSENSLYTISSASELEELSRAVNAGKDYSGKFFQLTANLDLKGIDNWKPIGMDNKPFQGNFDGNGKTISGLKIDVTPNADGYYGLFGLIGENGTVKNLAVSGTVSVNTTEQVYVGGLVGNCKGTLQNCQFSGTVSGSGSANSYFGGVAGYVYSIKDSGNTGSVSGSGTVGGVAGMATTITNCYNTGSVEDTSDNAVYTGGVAGWVSDIINSYNVGFVSSSGTVGSVAGFVNTSNSNCFYLTGTTGETDKGVGEGNDTAASATRTQFENGEVAWKLQNSQTLQIWGQNLRVNKDAYPVPTSDKYKKVYQVKFDPSNNTTDFQYAYTNSRVSKPTPDPKQTGYTFDGWYNGESNFDFLHQDISEDLTLIAHWTLHENHDYVNGVCKDCGVPDPTSTSSGGGGGSSHPSTPTVTVPVSSEKGSVTAKATVKNGNASVEISDKQINQVAAEGAKNVTVDLTSLNNVTSATLPAHVVETTSNAKDVRLTVALPTGTVSLDSTALSSLPAGEDITVSVKHVPVTDLNEQQQAAVGDMANIGLVFDVDILVGKEKQSDFNGGKLTISVPYTPKKGEDPSKLTVWFIKDDGTIQPMGGYYDAEKQCFVFETTHLSRYVIVSVEDMLSFTDVPNDMYYADAVTWAVLHGITSGMTETTFGPDVSCTRAQIVTFLWRAAGQPEVTGNNPFSDVNESDYFYQAVLWAVEHKITTGTTETTFSPEDTCTRAQAASFIYRNEQANGEGFTNAWAFQLPFTDVPAWCYEAVAWCYMNGITQGTSETSFSPNLDCSRAQIVTMLYREYLL